MELPDNGDEPVWTTKFFHDPPEAISANSVEGLGQVDERGVEAPVLLDTLLLQLACSKDHISRRAARSKATLALGKKTILKVHQQAVEKEAGQDFPGDGKKGYPAVVVT